MAESSSLDSPFGPSYHPSGTQLQRYVDVIAQALQSTLS